MAKIQEKTLAKSADWKGLGVRVPPELARALRIVAAKNDKTMQDILVEAIRAVLKKYGEKIPNS
jgi:predicted transcriptional regulator